MFPVMLSWLLTISACFNIGKALHYLVTPTNIFCLERDKHILVRVGTLLVALVGCYPQYRTIRSILCGFGWISGDWKKEDLINKRKVYIIEPVVESLLQVIYSCCAINLDLVT